MMARGELDSIVERKDQISQVTGRFTLTDLQHRLASHRSREASQSRGPMHGVIVRAFLLFLQVNHHERILADEGGCAAQPVRQCM